MTMTHEELSQDLTALANARGLAERALHTCQRYLENSHEEDQSFCKGRLLSDLILKWNRHALVFGHRIFNRSYVETTIGIHLPDRSGVYFEKLRPIGFYVLVTDPVTGEIEDDFLDSWEEPGEGLE